MIGNRPAPWGECQRCGFKVRLSAMRKEWTNLRVCTDCFDPRPADIRPPHYGPEGLPRRDAAPATEPVFKEDLPAMFDPAFFDPAIFHTMADLPL